jgi:hypothetical protein
VSRPATSTFRLDAERVLRIAPGTLGQIECDVLDASTRCAVLADMLGDAVVWFAILPQAPRATVELPPIIDLIDGRAAFESGWRIPYAPVIERECAGEDIPTFGDFLRRFGPDSVTILDLETRQVASVRCGDAGGRVTGRSGAASPDEGVSSREARVVRRLDPRAVERVATQHHGAVVRDPARIGPRSREAWRNATSSPAPRPPWHLPSQGSTRSISDARRSSS